MAEDWANMMNDKTGVGDKADRDRVAVEFYMGQQVLSGTLPVASGRRLLDVINRIGDLDCDVQSDYIEFVSDLASEGEESREMRYVRKTAVELAALSDPDTARGAGATASPGVYPRVEKIKVRVSIEMPGQFLDGMMHCGPGMTIRDVLDENTPFLPLTEVTIVRDNHVYGTRAFVAARKDRIFSVRQEGPR